MKPRVPLLLAVVATFAAALALLAAELRVGSALERRAYDSWFRLRGPLERSGDVVIVAIDVDSEQSLGRYPWSREWHARLVRNLHRAGARTVAFDATFGDAFPAEDAVLRQEIDAAGNVILGAKSNALISARASRSELEEPAGPLRGVSIGLVDIRPDAVDGVIRAYPMLEEYPGGRRVAQLGVQALLEYLDLPEEAFQPIDGGWQLGDRFEQVMAYFWVTEAQRYLQGLGFGTGELPAVNKESQDIRINQWGQDNSYSWDKHDVIRLGKGGVDDAEDGEVVVHEYGHAVHDSQVAGFGASLDAGAIGEAFGDYLAVTVGLHTATVHDWPVNAPAACVADWDAVSYTTTEPHCLRRIDSDLTVADRRNQVHFDGQIWSRALWDVRGALGASTADRIIVNAQFGFAPDSSFAAAAQTTVDTARQMYGDAAASAVRVAFQARGILS
jgi:hypothetical protein